MNVSKHTPSTEAVAAALDTVLTASVFVMLALLSGCKADAPPAGPPPPMPVQVVTAAQQDVPQTGEWVATTDGFVNAQIQPQVSGYLIRQDYKEGSEVHKGQVLFEIDPRPFQAALDGAKGNLAQAQAQLALAGVNVDRDKPLADAHAIARSQLDTDLGNQATSKATVANAQASVQSAELNLGFTKVRSLIDGVAGQATVQVGNLVGTSSVLTSVSQLNPIKVYFYISEQEYLSLSARAKSSGKSDLISSGSVLPLKLTLTDGQVYPQAGRISFVDRAVSAQTGSIRIAATFPNPGNLLRPGQFGRISANTSVEHNAVVVPQRAVTELQGMHQVIVVGPDHVVHVRTVQLGSQVGQNIIIAKGLQPGETVVTEGLDKLRDGAKVDPQQDNSPALVSPSGQNTQGN